MSSISTETLEIAERIKPLLAGREPVLQSAILAELLSILLAGHWIPGEPEETATLRRTILATHCTLVLELTEVNAKIMGTDT
jgi:hypothetical protein